MGQADVDEFGAKHGVPIVDDDVARLDIPVENAANMEFAQAMEHADGNRQRLADGHRSAAQSRFQRKPFDVRHDQVQTVPVTAQIEQRRLLHVVQLAQQATFLLEPHARALRNRRAEERLDDDRLALFQVGGQQGLRTVTVFQDADCLIATAERPFRAPAAPGKASRESVLSCAGTMVRNPRLFRRPHRPAVRVGTAWQLESCVPRQLPCRAKKM